MRNKWKNFIEKIVQFSEISYSVWDCLQFQRELIN